MLALVVAGALPHIGVGELELTPSLQTNPDATVRSTDLVVPAAKPAAKEKGGRATYGTAQTAPRTPAPEGGGDPADVVAAVTQEETDEFGLVGVSWTVGSAPEDLAVEVRTKADGAWSDWEALEVADAVDEGTEAEREGTDPIWTGTADGVDVRLRSAEAAPADIELTLIDGGTGLAVEPDGGAALMSGGVARPPIRTRAQWGVDESTQVSCSAPTTASAARGVTLHHTAGRNGYTREEAPGIMRGMHRYHTATLGWCDIGYNFVVDTYGTIYVGRRGGPTKQVRGAHAGNNEANTYFTGVSMMGNFETAQLTTALKQSVARLIAWRLDQFGLDPNATASLGGKRVPVIHGHRDIHLAGVRPATATACPGRYGDAWLKSTLRGEVAALIAAAPAPAPTPTPTPAPKPTDPEQATAPPTPKPQPPAQPRVAGSNRYATAAAVSRETFPTGASVAFIASGTSFPDALGAGPAAGISGAPVLLADARGLPAETSAELARLRPSRVFVLGGTMVLPAPVVRQTRQVLGTGTTIQRLSGTSRYDTAAAVTSHFWEPGQEVVYVASGESYPDALSGGALAALHKAPIVLVGKAALPDGARAELRRLQPQRVVLLGGQAAITEDVMVSIGQALPTTQVRRVSGANRYATSTAIAQLGWRNAGRAWLAAGTDFPDALSAVPAAAAERAPLLLTQQQCLPAEVGTLLKTLGVTERLLLGGTLALADAAATRGC
ncbi:cell wall-binding repeat-containing protein [Nocardioides massiliensis]|uniref:Cell wall-binding protein n=1 Tax=Nocardioides massiliensis TaxID=1325935 RepID=A0ABT9NNJ4_9ACTN|nr:cell wall-binding repeat-containing protein [Nocardioides massiliensis]MDP9821625.1 putative cell wall-binding protein [Nocardioides massiliensis]